MSIRPKPVDMKYFGNVIGNCQDPDEPGDQQLGSSFEKISGQGSKGGGSKKTSIPKGSANHKKGTYPKHPQKLRGR